MNIMADFYAHMIHSEPAENESGLTPFLLVRNAFCLRAFAFFRVQQEV